VVQEGQQQGVSSLLKVFTFAFVFLILLQMVVSVFDVLQIAQLLLEASGKGAGNI
jgi:hypothetical protein